eukprot:TRINITY_DN6503_c0_g1_i2.p1 TRINITY_DN6503_c0_g1~~TRINITY_DN6503_c0_g1_i2.p1  ORF type:complete len:568 (-),score=115.53 TRINITY_DN6503_c0_g1_i2:16-1656(-)
MAANVARASAVVNVNADGSIDGRTASELPPLPTTVPPTPLRSSFFGGLVLEPPDATFSAARCAPALDFAHFDAGSTDKDPVNVKPSSPRCTLSTKTNTTVSEVAEDLVCPISQSLMVDPVVASDGHTYDRPNIEEWFGREAAEGRTQPKSPLTREPLPDARLVPNLVLRRTLERLVDSGRLEQEMADEWRKAKDRQRERLASAARERSLARFPLSTEVELPVELRILPPAEQPQDWEADFLVDVHARHRRSLFSDSSGPPARETGRVLLQAVPVSSVLRASGPPATLSVRAFLELTTPTEGPGPAPLPQEELLRHVFRTSSPAASSSSEGGAATGGGGDGTGSSASTEELEDAGLIGSSSADGLIATRAHDLTLALTHIVKRLACNDGGWMPAGVRSEWEMLDENLHRRHVRRTVKALRTQLKFLDTRLRAIVSHVGANGEFTLSFWQLHDAAAGAIGAGSAAVPGAASTPPGAGAEGEPAFGSSDAVADNVSRCATTTVPCDFPAMSRPGHLREAPRGNLLESNGFPSGGSGGIFARSDPFSGVA